VVTCLLCFRKRVGEMGKAPFIGDKQFKKKRKSNLPSRRGKQANGGEGGEGAPTKGGK